MADQNFFGETLPASVVKRPLLHEEPNGINKEKVVKLPAIADSYFEP